MFRLLGKSSEALVRRDVFALFAITLAGLLLKLLIIGSIVSQHVQPSPSAPMAATVAIVCVLAIPVCGLQPRRQLIAAVALNAAATFLALTDLWHFRLYGEPWSLAEATALGQLPLVISSVAAIVRLVDALAFVDIVLILFWVQRSQAGMRLGWRSNPLTVVPLTTVATAAAVYPLWLIWQDPAQVFRYEFEKQELVASVGIAGYHAFDLATHVLYPVLGRMRVTDADLAAVEATITAHQRNQLRSRLTGIARGQNVVLISAESLHAFALDAIVNGQPLMPNLAAFASESLHYTKFYDQTHMGTTSDAEFMAMTSLLPLPAGAVATRYDSNTFRALPHVLKERGYATLSACAEPSRMWNMRQMHARFGFGESLFEPSFPNTRWLGGGKDDVSFFEEVVPRLGALERPFFAFLLSSVNHHPYQLPTEKRRLDPPPISEGMAADYLQTVRYFDEAFGTFVRKLEAEGLLDKTVVVVYGDHHSLLPDDELVRLWNLTGRGPLPPSQLELWKFRRTLPFLIRLPRGTAAGRRDVPAGHVDILPTIISLVGAESAPGPWLGRDLTAPGPRLVVFRDGSVTNGVVTALTSPPREWTCYDSGGNAISCEHSIELRAAGRTYLETSDDVIRGDLATRITSRFQGQPPWQSQDPLLVIGHRGNSIHYPENTLAAIRSAFDLGADAVEVDVRLTRDGVPIVFHDDRLERTTNGRGDAADLTLAAVKQLDAGSWKSPRFSGARVPTLEEVILEARGRGRLLLDLKREGLGSIVAGYVPATRCSLRERDRWYLEYEPATRLSTRDAWSACAENRVRAG